MIELEHLTKQYEDLVAVNDVTLSIAEGEVLALLGPNGAGKTTTVRMLSAILQPTAGRARVAGLDVVTQAREVRRIVGMLTEAPGLYTRMTGREYLEFFASMYGVPASITRRRIAELAERFEMEEALDRRLGYYSKGMAQKIALIRALVHDPQVLMLDEPTSAMDPQSARLVRNTIMDLRREKRTIIVCTHNLPEAEELADRIAIIRKGRIVTHGTLAELKRQLLGAPLMELRWLAPPHNGVLDRLRTLAEIQQVSPHGLRYVCEHPEQVNPLVLRALHEAEVPVLSLSEVPRNLEAVYLRVVGEVAA